MNEYNVEIFTEDGIHSQVHHGLTALNVFTSVNGAIDTVGYCMVGTPTKDSHDVVYKHAITRIKVTKK